jgi:hypothetical protein
MADDLHPPPPPPRAFTQGVGTVFQFVGVTLFLAMLFVCCASSFFGKSAVLPELTRFGWHLRGDPADAPTYSAQRAITTCVFVGVFLGMALAGIGLGLQAMNRRAPWLAVAVTGGGTLFWLVHTVFIVQFLHSVVLALLGSLLTVGFAALLALAATALREMLQDPPPPGQEILPADYKVPYSHLHEDPPEVRLERELAQRRQRLGVQQKELELLEEKLRRKTEQKNDQSGK